MNVTELIEALRKYPGDLPVRVRIDFSGPKELGPGGRAYVMDQMLELTRFDVDVNRIEGPPFVELRGTDDTGPR